MQIQDIINIDAEILGGTPVFTGTRVPVKHRCDYLEGGHTLEEFLDDFYSVRREQAVLLLRYALKISLDECMPRQLRRHLDEHEVWPVFPNFKRAKPICLNLNRL